MKFLMGFLLVSGLSLSAYAEQKIAVVDMQNALRLVSAGKDAKAKLEKEFSAKQAEFQKKEKALVDLKTELEKKAMALSEEQKQKKAMEFNQKMMAFREEVAQSQQAISNKERELTIPIIEALRKEIESIAKDKKYDIILEKNEQSVMFASKEYDVTAEVVKNFEKNWKKKK